MQFDGPWTESTLGAENKYRYNGKELVGELGLNWYAYGARYYDAAIGRFTGVDPISDQFPWVSTYNYAENEPVANIDLHGLQAFPINAVSSRALGSLRSQLGNPDKKIQRAMSSISSDTRKRTNLFLSGAGNATLGVLGTVGAAASTSLSGGATAFIMVATLSEVGIGVSQMVDAVAGDADANSPLHESSNAAGLAAHSIDSDYAGVIDAAAAVGPGLVAGGISSASGLDDLIEAGKSLRKGDVRGAAKSGFQANDAAGDTAELAEQVFSLISPSPQSQQAQKNTNTMKILTPHVRFKK